MFTIPVGDILSSYTWDSKKFSFSGEVFDGYMEDLSFHKPLEFTLQLVALDDWVSALFEDIRTEVEYEGKMHSIHIGGFDRTWKRSIDPTTDDDDIWQLDVRSMTIDLAPVIREEIIMACH
jgi:hypothetical protein